MHVAASFAREPAKDKPPNDPRSSDMDAWHFGQPTDSLDQNGIHRIQQLFLNGIPIGRIELHARRRTGTANGTEVSWTVTAVCYGAPHASEELEPSPNGNHRPAAGTPLEMSPLLQPPDYD